jgi:hypothetical protein
MWSQNIAYISEWLVAFLDCTVRWRGKLKFEALKFASEIPYIWPMPIPVSVSIFIYTLMGMKPIRIRSTGTAGRWPPRVKGVGLAWLFQTDFSTARIEKPRKACWALSNLSRCHFHSVMPVLV